MAAPEGNQNARKEGGKGWPISLYLNQEDIYCLRVAFNARHPGVSPSKKDLQRIAKETMGMGLRHIYATYHTDNHPLLPPMQIEESES